MAIGRRRLQDLMLQICEAERSQIKSWRTGVQFAAELGLTVDQLCVLATIERWKQSRTIRLDGNRCIHLRPPRYRIAVNRFYYSMYHAFRSVAYHYYDGDDHQEHRDLPTKLPSDFPDADKWKNRLKNARELRNQADYTPFPKSDAAWKRNALELAIHAREAELLTKSYLQTRGVAIR